MSANNNPSFANLCRGVEGSVSIISKSSRFINLWQLGILLCALHGVFYFTVLASQFLKRFYTGIFSELVVMLSIAFLFLPILALSLVCFASMVLPSHLKKGFIDKSDKPSISSVFQKVGYPCGQEGKSPNA